MILGSLFCVVASFISAAWPASIPFRQAHAHQGIDAQLQSNTSTPSTPPHLSFSGANSTMSTTADSRKYVVAHHMVGNTYPYTSSDWESDIALAHANGLDGFALNVGVDSWQPARVADAYAAAARSNLDFKLFISLDMSSFPCNSPQDAQVIRNFVSTYFSHPNQLQYASRALVSTFAGESCTFGQGSAPQGWKTQFACHPDINGKVFFMPSFFIAPSEFSNYGEVINGVFNWNAAWPTRLTTSSIQSLTAVSSSDVLSVLDSLGLSLPSSTPPQGKLQAMVDAYIGSMIDDIPHLEALAALQPSQNGGTQRAYMAPVSPWFFTHYGADTYNKNFIYVSDEHLYVKRWESLYAARDQVDIVQVLTFNDYGESHYVGPIEGAQPNSQSWVNGFDHTAWLKMTKYYATAFKTGSFPPIVTDQLYMWARPHPANAVAPGDPVGPPDNSILTQDRVWAVVMATQPSTVIICTDPNLSPDKQQSFEVPAGVTRLSVPIRPGGKMHGVIMRGSETILELQPQGFTFNGSPSRYNFNAFVAGAEAVGK